MTLLLKKLSSFFFILLISILAGKGVYFVKKGFSLRRVHPVEQSLLLGLTPEVKNILDQPFYYLGRGRQCFAFASQDDRFVLKVPRSDIFTTPFWLKALPLKQLREKKEEDQAKRQQFLINSFVLSFEKLGSQTGTIALHIGQSYFSDKNLTLVDASGAKHHLPISQTTFALQHKYPLWSKQVEKALAQQDESQVKNLIDALVDVIVQRANNGILNRDRSFLRNYGYNGKEAVQIDIGSFFISSQIDNPYEKSIRDSLDPVQEWLKEKDPEALSYLNNKIKNLF